MVDNKQPEQNDAKVQVQKPAPSRPNEMGSIAISGFIKIFDPATKEVYVETRA
jgi:hypothetical protein